MARATLATIDLDAVRHNYRLAKRLAGGARVLAVVKADGYGHGAVPVARALRAQADAFAVACLEEALELRGAGVDGRLLLLQGCYAGEELAQVAAQRLDLTVHHRDQVEMLLRTRLPRPLSIWLKFDSGMHRLGFEAAGLRAAFRDLSASGQCAEIVLMTHFARAEEADRGATEEQIARFEAATEGLPGPRSLCNSAGVLAWPGAHGDWVRPGIMLYGVSPFAAGRAEDRALRPAMRLTSALIAVRDLGPGEAIGYGARFRCERPMRVGVVAAGYGDGYPRGAADGTPVLVRGRRTRLVGRVSMDMLTVDLSGIEEAAVGDPVELWGEGVAAAEVAAASDTIGYEILTRRPPRVPRRYLGQSP